MKLGELYLQEYTEIMKIPVQENSLHQAVKSYLVHYGYVETLQALEYDNGFLQEVETECATSMQVDQSFQN